MLVADGHLGEDRAPRVLDLYAGSGALAFEALSRGASDAVVIDESRDAIAAIRDNARTFGIEARVRVVPGAVERSLAKVGTGFGIVFVDPPYADVPTSAFRAVLDRAASLVDPGGVLVLEHRASDESPSVEGLTLDRTRRHGDTALSLHVAPGQPE